MRTHLLSEYLRVLEATSERVMFQADSLNRGPRGYEPDGYVVTGTTNLISSDELHKGRGTVLFTSSASGATTVNTRRRMSHTRQKAGGDCRR